MCTSQPVYLISSCLLSLCTRYDGKIKTCPKALEHLHNAILIPVCPAQLGGLSTPREAADLIGGDGHDAINSRASVLTKGGTDVTAAFIRGAEQTLKIVQMQNISKAILKTRSPSCAVTGKIGVTAALLQKHNIETIEIE